MVVTERIVCQRLPLALYYEVAAHLQQLGSLEVEILPQVACNFDYLQSQVGGLMLHYSGELPSADARCLKEILEHYARRYGDWVRASI